MSREGLVPGEVQMKPRGWWRPCLYKPNGDGTATAFIGGQQHTVRMEQIRPRGAGR